MAKATFLLLATTIVLVAIIFPMTTSAAHSPAAAPGPMMYTGAPAPGPDCFTYLLNLSDCLTYVEAGSNLTVPDKACCPELANLVDTQPICLCELLGNPQQSPVPIDLPKAMGLPKACKVNAPDVSMCAVLGIPVSAPAPAPAAGGPSAVGGLSPEGAAPSPTSGNKVNAGQSTTASQRHFLVGFAIALFISFF